MDNTIPNQLEALTADHLANVEQQIAECDQLRERLQHLHGIYRQILELLRADYIPTPVGAAMANVSSIATAKAVKAKHPVVDGGHGKKNPDDVQCAICGKWTSKLGSWRHAAMHRNSMTAAPVPPVPKAPAPIADDKALLVRCEDCDIAYMPHQLRQLAEHVRVAHRRAMTKNERTPSVA